MKKRYSEGFTLIEMLVVMAIIAIMSVALILNFRESSRTKNTLQRESLAIVAALRQAQSLSVASAKFNNIAPCGYGLHYDPTSKLPIVFFRPKSGGNCSLARKYDSSVDLEYSKVRFQSVSVEIKAPIFYDVYFQPPDPKTYINDVDPYIFGAVGTDVIIGFSDRACSSSPNCRKISVYPTGRIEVTDYP